VVNEQLMIQKAVADLGVKAEQALKKVIGMDLQGGFCCAGFISSEQILPIARDDLLKQSFDGG
jgi:hypothetical protein